MHKSVTIAFLFISLFCFSQAPLKVLTEKDIKVGAQRFDLYLPQLTNKKVAIVTNISGVIGKTSIVDTLLKLKVDIKKIFGPEHGFRGSADAGQKVKSNIDKKTRLPVISLYGTHKKPNKEDLKGIDVVIYDIQDVGVRFYTFISTLAYVMEACAEEKIHVIVLDRPDPNGFYVDGPVMTDKYKSFLGMYNIPVVYGMTSGEFAKMIDQEGWLVSKIKTSKKDSFITKKVYCDLTVVAVEGYEHSDTYNLPVKPSPNLPDLNSILLYPSLGLFEGTIISLGRGTEMPFLVIGNPAYSKKEFSFTPMPTSITKEPKYKGIVCFGKDLRKEQPVQNPVGKIKLNWLIDFYRDLKSPIFFDENFNYHSGNDALQEQIKQGKSEEEIRKSWQEDIKKFKLIRKKYLLYKDFE